MERIRVRTVSRQYTYPGGVPDGQNVAYFTGGASGGYIGQVVEGTALIASHIYNLSVYVGKRLDLNVGQTYGLQLLGMANC